MFEAARRRLVDGVRTNASVIMRQSGTRVPVTGMGQCWDPLPRWRHGCNDKGRNQLRETIFNEQEQSQTAYLRQGERRPNPDPDPDFGSGRLPKFNEDLLVQSYVCVKDFMKIRLVCA